MLARNKAAGYFGPRHGNTALDHEKRTRTPVLLGGTTSYLTTTTYNAAQFGLGTVFTIDVLWKFDDPRKCFFVSLDSSSFKNFEITSESDYTVKARLYAGAVHSLVSDKVIGDEEILHIRVVRDRGTAYLYVNGVLEATDTTLTATTALGGATGALLVGKAPTYSSGYNYAKGTFGGVWIRSIADLSLDYTFAEIPCFYGPEVLAAWTGEGYQSAERVYDRSRFCNPLLAYNCANGTDFLTTVQEPVQYAGTHILRDGRRHNIVVVGGKVHVEIL